MKAQWLVIHIVKILLKDEKWGRSNFEQLWHFSQQDRLQLALSKKRMLITLIYIQATRRRQLQ